MCTIMIFNIPLYNNVIPNNKLSHGAALTFFTVKSNYVSAVVMVSDNNCQTKFAPVFQAI